MKHFIKVLKVLLFFTQFNNSCLSQQLNHHDFNQTELFSKQTVLNNTNIIPSVHNLFTLYDHLGIINDFIKLSKLEKLFIIIAENLKDSVKLAEILSDKNRVLPERKQDIPNVNLIYNEIVENYYLYYNKNTSVHIFLYPSNVSNEILATYLTKRTLKSSKELKIALTCTEEYDKNTTFDSMFLIGAKILRNINWNHSSELKDTVIFLPPDIKQSQVFVNTTVNNLEEHFYKTFSRFGNSSNISTLLFNINSNLKNLSNEEKLQTLIIGTIVAKNTTNLTSQMNDLSVNPERILISNYLQRSNNLEIRTFLKFNDTDENLKSLQEKISLLGEISLNGTFLREISTVTGVLEFSHWIKSAVENLSTYLSEDGQIIEKIIISLCDSEKRLEIISLVCFMKYMSNDTFYDSKIWRESLKSFSLNYLKDKEAWFNRLVKLYKNERNQNEIDISSESHLLFQEISKIGAGNQELMKESFFTMNNFINTKPQFSCSPLETGKYKLQIKGKFLNFGQILQKNYCPGKISLLEMSALEKIIINEDLISGENQTQIILIAPIWEIVSKRTINLDGVDGNNTWRSQKLVPEYANYVTYIDGLPGIPGGNGGSFIAIADTIIKGENLHLSTNGGRGGDGQDGADGLSMEGRPHPVKFEKLGKVHASGEGGKKGPGGTQGMVHIFFLNNSTDLNINKIAKNGSDGKDGKHGTMETVLKNRTIEFVLLNRTLRAKEHVSLIHKIRLLSRNHKISYIKIKDFYSINPHYLINKQIEINDLFSPLTNYREYVMTNIFESGTSANLYRKLNNNPDLVKILNTLVFLNEIFNLEDYYSLRFDKSNVTKSIHMMYSFWLEGLEFYRREPHDNEKTIDHQVLFSKLQDMTLRKLNKLQENFSEKPIVKIDIYLKQSIADGKKLRNIEVLDKLQNIGTEFKNIFQKEIEDAKKLIDEELQVYLEKRIEDLNLEIKQLIQEVNEMIKRKKREIEILKKKKRELEKKLALREIFTIFRFLFLGLSFINPVCAVIGSVLSAGVSIAEENALNSNSDAPFEEIKLPDSVTETIQSTYAKYNEKISQEITTVENKLNDIKSKQNKLHSLGEDTQPLIDLEKNIYNTCISKRNQTSSPRQCMIDILEFENVHWSRKDGKIKKKYEKSLIVMKSITVSLDIVKTSLESYNKIKSDMSALENLNEQIKKEENDVRNLEHFKRRIFQQLEPQIQQIRNNIRKAINGYSISSRAVLEYRKFQMDIYLMNLSTELDIWTKKFQIADEITKTMAKVKSAMNAIIKMHKLIKEFNFKIKNADYFKDIASTPFQIANINDTKLLTALTKLEQIYYSNDMLDDYNKLIIAMKGYTYPRLREFSDFTSSLHQFFHNSLIKGSIIIEKMKHLESNLNKRKGHGKIFDDVTQTKFGNNGSLPSFYVWNNSVHGAVINDILKGKEVSLFANISHKTELNAVKFREIGILFTSSDSKINQELKNVLKEFAVKLTHNGDSYYRCMDKVHLIKSGASNTVIKFFIQKRKRFISDTDYVLSPFATWTIRLSSIWNSNNFAPLEKFVNKVNVELVGDGQFMLPNATICSSDYLHDYQEEVFIK